MASRSILCNKSNKDIETHLYMKCQTEAAQSLCFIVYIWLSPLSPPDLTSIILMECSINIGWRMEGSKYKYRPVFIMN